MRLPSRRRRRNRTLVAALYINAGLMAALLVAFLSRGNGGMFGGGTPAMAAMPQIGGGGGLYMMPAQFTQYNWGCYLMDIDKQTLVAYEYIQGTKQLRLVAARYFRHDRELHDFNTTPSPSEIERIVKVGKAGLRGQEQPPEGAGEGPATRPAEPGPENGPTPPPTISADFPPKPNENDKRE